MRLIDADRLLEDKRVEKYYHLKNGDVAIPLIDIKHAPTIEERKKGKWIDETFKPWGLVYHPYRCDQCGDHSEADSNFCPNCGADMRGEQDE